jgi:hypothetical protein
MIEFTHTTYRALLRHILGCGHAICPLSAVPDTGKYVILRHDIDYSVVKALELAEIEHELGVRTSVFLMLSSAYYNLLSLEQLRAARRIVALGHDIGFHYDTDVFAGVAPEQQGERIAGQARFLSELLETPVTTVAQHNPSVTPVRVAVPGYLDAYAIRFTKEIAYLSDSRRLFGTADPFRFFEQHDRVQFLIHPLWWSEDNKSRRDAFAAIRHAAVATIDEQLQAMNRSMERDEMARRMETRSDHA